MRGLLINTRNGDLILDGVTSISVVLAEEEEEEDGVASCKSGCDGSSLERYFTASFFSIIMIRSIISIMIKLILQAKTAL